MEKLETKRLIKKELKTIYSHLNLLLDDTLESLINMKQTLIYFKTKNRKVTNEEQSYLDKFILDVEEISTKTQDVLDDIDELPNRERLSYKLEYVRKEFVLCKKQIELNS